MNKQGFSLIGVIVSMGIVAILTLAVAAFSKDVTDFLSRADRSKTMLDVMEELRFTLAVNAQCINNFKGKNIAAPISKVSSFDKNNAENSAIVTSGQSVRSIKVESIVFRKTGSLSTAFTLADLVVQFHDETKPGTAPFERTLPMIIQVQTGVIQNCWLTKDKTDVEVDQVCQVITNGALTAYDAASKKCVLPNGKWFTGTATQASCPAGTLLPPAANTDTNCAVEMAAGFSDTFPSFSIPMTGGGTASATRSPTNNSLNSATKTCTCDWATDLPASAQNGASCQILCLVP